MIKDITIGQFLPGESLLHKTDPRVKILLVMLYISLVFLSDTYSGFLILTLFTLLVIAGSGIPIIYTLKGLKPILFIVAFAAIINIFTVKGTIVFEAGFIHVTLEGLDIAAKMAIRISLMITGASLLTFTTTPISLTDGIEKLLGPLKKIKVPVHEISMMMTIALRFIPTLLDETDKIIKAQASRGADFDSGNIIQRAKSFIPVLVPLFISAFRRADELAVAMEARCYRGSVGRTRMKQLKFTVADVEVILIMLILTAGLMILQYIVYV
jgi:energy-coupling factor transport system permease protein